MAKEDLWTRSYIKIDESVTKIEVLKDDIYALRITTNQTGDLLFSGNRDGSITIIDTRTN